MIHFFCISILIISNLNLSECIEKVNFDFSENNRPEEITQRFSEILKIFNADESRKALNVTLEIIPPKSSGESIVDEYQNQIHKITGEYAPNLSVGGTRRVLRKNNEILKISYQFIFSKVSSQKMTVVISVREDYRVRLMELMKEWHKEVQTSAVPIFDKKVIISASIQVDSSRTLQELRKFANGLFVKYSSLGFINIGKRSVIGREIKVELLLTFCDRKPDKQIISDIETVLYIEQDYQRELYALLNEWLSKVSKGYPGAALGKPVLIKSTKNIISSNALDGVTKFLQEIRSRYPKIEDSNIAKNALNGKLHSLSLLFKAVPPSKTSNVDNPNEDNTSVFNPNAGKSGASNPNAGSSDAFNPNAGKSGASNPNAGSSDAFNPNAGKSGASNPNGGKSSVINPNEDNPNAGSSDAFNPNAGKSDAFKLSAGKIGVFHPDAGNSGAFNLNAGNSGSSNPNAGKSGASNPNAGKSGNNPSVISEDAFLEEIFAFPGVKISESLLIWFRNVFGSSRISFILRTMISWFIELLHFLMKPSVKIINLYELIEKLLISLGFTRVEVEDLSKWVMSLIKALEDSHIKEIDVKLLITRILKYFGITNIKIDDLKSIFMYLFPMKIHHLEVEVKLKNLLIALGISKTNRAFKFLAHTILESITITQKGDNLLEWFEKLIKKLEITVVSTKQLRTWKKNFFQKLEENHVYTIDLRSVCRKSLNFFEIEKINVKIFNKWVLENVKKFKEFPSVFPNNVVIKITNTIDNLGITDIVSNMNGVINVFISKNK